MVKAYNIKYRLTCYDPITKEEKLIYSYNRPYELAEESETQVQKEKIIGFSALAENFGISPMFPTTKDAIMT